MRSLASTFGVGPNSQPRRAQLGPAPGPPSGPRTSRFGPSASVTCQRVGAGGDQVVEVEHPPPDPLLFVADEDVGHLVRTDATAALGPACLRGVAVGGHETRLGPSDLAVERPHPAGITGDDVGQEAPAVREQLGLGPQLGPYCTY